MEADFVSDKQNVPCQAPDDSMAGGDNANYSTIPEIFY